MIHCDSLRFSSFSLDLSQCSSSPERKTDEPLYSEAFESPGNRTTSPYKEETVLSPSGSVDSGTLSPTLSEGELSRVSEVASGSPTHTSAQVGQTHCWSGVQMFSKVILWFPPSVIGLKSRASFSTFDK